MQNNSIYIFFLALCLLFWNPLTYQWIYAGTPVTQTPHMLVIFGVLFMLGLLIIWGLRRNFFGPKGKNRIFSLSFLGILFALLVGVDGLVGMMRAKDHEGIIFHPNTEVKYQTIEFDIVAKTNELGLRDHSIEPDKKDKYRILCFGDSWTFGWGVNIEQSWPKVLERQLQASGMPNAEVINCGQGGQHPLTYLKYVKKAVPLLKPDIVLVGLLQGDDLAQLYENTHFQQQGKMEGGLLRQFIQIGKLFVKSSFVNIISGRNDINDPSTLNIHNTWKNSVHRMISDLPPVQTVRYRSLNDTMRQYFESGDLNPANLNWILNFPERELIFNDPTNPATQEGMEMLVGILKEMKDVCSKYNCQLIVANLPSSYYTGHRVKGSLLNLTIRDYIEHNNGLDSLYRTAAALNQLEYIELTEHFRKLEDKTQYYFPFDGHPNENGYAEIGQYIGDTLINHIKLKTK